MKLPQRRPLATEAVKVIQEMIESGELQQRLPGERALSERLQIGRDTLRAALVELQHQGWISVGSHGKHRQILKNPSKKKETQRSKRIGFLSPKRLELLPPTMLLELDHVREILARMNISLELHSPAVFTSGSPGSKLQDLVESFQYDAWILYQSTEQVQNWFQQQRIPCIVRGHPYLGIELPSLDLDWQATGFHAAALLSRNGHQSIGLMMPDTQLQGLFTAQKGIESALSQSTDDIVLHTIKEQGTAEAVAASLEKIYRAKNPPTAIIATRSRQVLTLISWLATHGLSIPKNISLISLPYDNVFNALVPKIAHYTMDQAIAARGVVRIVDAVIKGKTTKQKLIIPKFIPGGSVKKRGE